MNDLKFTQLCNHINMLAETLLARHENNLHSMAVAAHTLSRVWSLVYEIGTLLDLPVFPGFGPNEPK